MKKAGIILLVISQSLYVLTVSNAQISFSSIVPVAELPDADSQVDDNESNQLVAVNDTFEFINGCNSSELSGCVITNDNLFNDIKVCYVVAPEEGMLTFGTNGKFYFSIDKEYCGQVSFKYRICDPGDSDAYYDARVIINIKGDNDCDNIENSLDIDDDNDGIVDEDEFDGQVDSDNDGIPDSFDIDSDNDGITDLQEWQRENNYISPSGIDANNNGWDDSYDTSVNGTYYALTDTDSDGIPDCLDTDSDNDNISDHVEGYDTDFDGIAEINYGTSDIDFDGLDDSFDNILDRSDASNPSGCLSPLPDGNQNGRRDWREAKEESSPGIDNPLTGFNESIVFYPNPSSGLVHFSIPASKENEGTLIQLYSMGGTLLHEENIREFNFTKDYGQFRQGSYIVRIRNNNFLHTGKLQLLH